MFLLNQIAMAYGSKLLFTEVTLKLNGNTRYALVGANGTGKSTLLRLITGEETPIDGNLSAPRNASIGWLKQDQFRYEDTQIIEIVLQGKPQLWQALQEKEQLLNATTYTEAIGYRLGELEEIIAHCNGYSAFAFAEKLLLGLGIPADYHYRPLNALSGGYKLRVLLAQTLFQEPDILLLDEPTNHLDIVSIAWLEKFLKTEFLGLLIFISHDVEFINRLADKILDIDYGEIREYSGNYDKFLAEKRLIEEQKLQEKKQVEEKIAHMQAFVDRFKAKASKARQAQSRMKMIEKLEIPDIKQSSRIAPIFKFKLKRPSGKIVLKVKKLTKHYQDACILKNVNFEIQRGEKIAIVGSNGAGKSTLLRCLLGKTTHDEGQYEWGHEAHIGYFSQNHHDDLNHSTSALEWLTTEAHDHPNQEIRKILGQMLFTQEQVHKDIMTLSGGEAARLLLGRMILQQANILVLDEPTNHLDIETTDALAAALAEYPGTVIVVSHNRHFINKIANRVLFVTKGSGVQDFKGKYSEFEALQQ
ncbi:MAG: ABC-F family ATP-binding cassette domain-containing protein [Coxiellaceae bacterium]|nr:MAG: ABC-F family ATP-binding cassette domain-containing protein [Coxiellaceae bacterium]